MAFALTVEEQCHMYTAIVGVYTHEDSAWAELEHLARQLTRAGFDATAQYLNVVPMPEIDKDAFWPAMKHILKHSKHTAFTGYPDNMVEIVQCGVCMYSERVSEKTGEQVREWLCPMCMSAAEPFAKVL